MYFVHDIMHIFPEWRRPNRIFPAQDGDTGRVWRDLIVTNSKDTAKAFNEHSRDPWVDASSFA